MLINIALDWISQQEIKEKISRKMDSSDFYVENGNPTNPLKGKISVQP